MPHVVELPLDDGEVVLVEVDDAESAQLERVGRTATAVYDATETLQDALRRTKPAVQAVVRQMRELAPDKITLKFGVKLTAAAGVVIAHAASEANFEVSVEWNATPQS